MKFVVTLVVGTEDPDWTAEQLAEALEQSPLSLVNRSWTFGVQNLVAVADAR